MSGATVDAAPQLERFWIYGEGRLLDFVDELDANRALRAWLLLTLRDGEELAPFEGGSTTLDGCRYVATTHRHGGHHERSA